MLLLLINILLVKHIDRVRAAMYSNRTRCFFLALSFFLCVNTSFAHGNEEAKRKGFEKEIEIEVIHQTLQVNNLERQVLPTDKVATSYVEAEEQTVSGYSGTTPFRNVKLYIYIIVNLP